MHLRIPFRILTGFLCLAALTATSLAAPPTKYARFQVGDRVAYGIVDGQRVREIDGDLFGQWKVTDKSHPLKDVKLLVPTKPRHVFAMAGNYKSHLGGGATTTIITTTTRVTFDPASGETSSSSTTEQETRVPGEVPELFRTPQPFFKSPSCLTAHETNIVIPKNSTGVVHYEAELVVVIGRKAHNVPKQAALDYVLGVTCGNDVSERTWQKGDVQWWRAKASDTFGPCGPFIVSGLDYDNLDMELRVNGEVKQKENTKQLIHDVASTVSFISQHVTLHPGDLIFTGTPGETSVIKPGDVVEVEVEGVGVLRNKVAAEE